MDEDFLAEAEDLIGTLSNGLLRYEKAYKAGSKIDPDILNGIFRAAHTLKGLVGVFGFQDMGKLAHAMENLLSRLRLGQISADENLLDILFKAVEKLEEILASQTPNIIDIEDVLQKLNQAAEAKTKAVKPVASSMIKIPKNIRQALSEYEESRLAENLRADLSIVIVKATFSHDDFDSKLPQLQEWLKKHGEVIATLPMSEEQGDQAISFQLLFATGVNLEKLGEVLNRYKYKLEILKRG